MRAERRARIRIDSMSAPEVELVVGDRTPVGDLVLDFVFTRHRPGDLEPLFGGFGIEERDVLFAPALAFEVNRQSVRARSHQYPEDAPAVFGVAHRGRDLREDALIDAGIAVHFARAQR